MRRLLAFAMFLAACGGGDETATTTATVDPGFCDAVERVYDTAVAAWIAEHGGTPTEADLADYLSGTEGAAYVDIVDGDVVMTGGC